MSGGIQAGSVVTNIQQFELAADETTTSTSFVDSGITITISDNTGKFKLTTMINNSLAALGANFFIFSDGGTGITAFRENEFTATGIILTTMSLVGENDGQIVKIQKRVSASTQTIFGASSGGDTNSSLEVLEVS